MTTKYDIYITCLNIDTDPHPTLHLVRGNYHELGMSIEGYYPVAFLRQEKVANLA